MSIHPPLIINAGRISKKQLKRLKRCHDPPSAQRAPRRSASASLALEDHPGAPSQPEFVCSNRVCLNSPVPGTPFFVLYF